MCMHACTYIPTHAAYILYSSNAWRIAELNVVGEKSLANGIDFGYKAIS